MAAVRLQCVWRGYRWRKQICSTSGRMPAVESHCEKRDGQWQDTTAKQGWDSGQSIILGPQSQQHLCLYELPAFSHWLSRTYIVYGVSGYPLQRGHVLVRVQGQDVSSMRAFELDALFRKAQPVELSFVACSPEECEVAAALRIQAAYRRWRAFHRQVDVATCVTWLLAAQRQVYVMPALDRQNQSMHFPRASPKESSLQQTVLTRRRRTLHSRGDRSFRLWKEGLVFAVQPGANDPADVALRPGDQLESVQRSAKGWLQENEDLPAVINMSQLPSWTDLELVFLEDKELAAVIRIQNCWRGHVVRRLFATSTSQPLAVAKLQLLRRDRELQEMRRELVKAKAVFRRG
eukprot:symbB.v1.2.034836.t1/scaffold4568.1/size37887/2